ncbi:MAG: tRNA pseudouridine(55) synthase TruB [Dehalococcoidia bacterium]|nr:tRNA pseudouridine(55) synthase TruB [Dehalococcoidia bacterium]
MAASGILNVNKDSGRTSYAVVALVKRQAGGAKVGHAGTLDPAATGVLLVCVGQAVRVSEYIMALPKVYRARVRLGFATDTYDAEGQATAPPLPVDVSRERLREVLGRFEGDIQQTPPAYSAVKVGGRAAYRLARQGEAVVLSPRPVRVYRLDLLSFEPPFFEIEVECGKGTYIRALAHDIGRELGCGGHLAALVRTRVGPFSIESAIPVADLEARLTDGSWRELLQPPDVALTDLPALTISMEDEKDLRHGQAVRLEEAANPPGPAPSDGVECRGYAEDGSLIGILRYDAGGGVWRPRKVFTAA